MDWWSKKKNKKMQILLEDLIECCDGKSNPIKFFSAHEILKATDNFSDSNYVVELYYSDYNCYSGKNENRHEILIMKDVNRFSHYYKGTFCRDIAVSSMVSGHKNFLKLVGCSLEFEYPVLVYHGVKNHYNLDVRNEPWKTRMKIAKDIATASYLHTAFPRPFGYRSMSLESILLEEDGVAKLTEFSYCFSIPKGETFVQIDREDDHRADDHNCVTSGIVLEKMDVFAFGIYLQRLLMGQRMIGCSNSWKSEEWMRSQIQRC